MAVPKTTVWTREGHTEGKHLVLEEYLKAWFPILGMGYRNRHILFIDGFSGPGEYGDGEEGSPLVAMRVLKEHAARKEIKAEVKFIFIEEKTDRVRHLKGLVDQWRPELPESADVHVLPGSFDSLMTGVLDQLDEQERTMPPALVMMDPFGVKGIPLDVIRRIMANPKCEVYVTFMWEAINRFLAQPEFEMHLTAMFGTDTWRDAISLGSRERKTFLHGLYRRQLKKAGAKQVVRFRLFAGNSHKYSVFFGTGNTTGSDRMKKAIWKIAPWGDFAFRGGKDDQLVLGLATPDFQPLQDQLREEFGGQGWVTVGRVLEFVKSDATIYHESQVRRPVLKPMEAKELLDVDGSTRKRRYTYPAGCKLQFRR